MPNFNKSKKKKKKKSNIINESKNKEIFYEEDSSKSYINPTALQEANSNGRAIIEIIAFFKNNQIKQQEIFKIDIELSVLESREEFLYKVFENIDRNQLPYLSHISALRMGVGVPVPKLFLKESFGGKFYFHENLGNIKARLPDGSIIERPIPKLELGNVVLNIKVYKAYIKKSNEERIKSLKQTLIDEKLINQVKVTEESKNSNLPKKWICSYCIGKFDKEKGKFCEKCNIPYCGLECLMIDSLNHKNHCQQIANESKNK